MSSSSTDVTDTPVLDSQSKFPLSGSSSPRPSAFSSFQDSPFLQADAFSHIRRPGFHTTIGSERPPAPSPNFGSSDNFFLNHQPEGNISSEWRLVRCENGLRYFEEITTDVIKYKFYKLPVMKCVGVVKADPSAIFDLVMDYGPKRCQWDSTIDSAQIIERKDGHSDVVFVKLRQEWIWLRKRYLCMSRHWVREENGSYSVFFKSVNHKDCPPQPGNVRAIIHSGGYIITPLKSSKDEKPRSLVEHVLEMDVAGWSSWFGIGLSQYPVYLRDSLLECVAGIRDFFAAQGVSGSSTVVKWKIADVEEPSSPLRHVIAQSCPSFLDTEDVEEEFFDATNEQFENAESPRDELVISIERPLCQPDYLTGDWTSEPQFNVDWTKFSGTVQSGPLLYGDDCWSEPEANSFLVRGKTFLTDGKRVPSGPPVFHLGAMDWFHSDDRMVHLARRPQNIVQKICDQYKEKAPYFFIINMQVPGAVHYSLVFYFVMGQKVKEGSLLHRFIHGDDVFRNSRLTLIPGIPEGSWVVKQAAGSRPVPLGQIMEVHYYSDDNYFEVDVNMGSSSVVRGVMSMIFGYITNLVVDMAFVLKGDTEDELPEQLLGVGRCSHLSLKSAKPPIPEN